MRILHVTESFADGTIEATILGMLRRFRAEDPSIEHHVLAFAGGPLEEAYREAAHAVTIGCDRRTIERQLAAPYDVAYILSERCAYRLLPELLARSAMPVVYGKGYEAGGIDRTAEGAQGRAEEAMLASCDAATFPTARLALDYDVPAGHTTILGGPTDPEPVSAARDDDAADVDRAASAPRAAGRERGGPIVERRGSVSMVPEIFRLVGSDRCLTAAEAASAAEAHPLTEAAWEVYAGHFGCFTGAALDPGFHYLSHPATRTGSVRVNADDVVVIVDAGSTLPSHMDALVRERDHLRLFSSLRGAEALLTRGIVPDLVLVEQETVFDARRSVRRFGDRGAPALARCPLVAADWRTPAPLVSSVPPAALFAPSRLPTWGLWPATAAALAVNAGAAAIALLGMDLGAPPGAAQAETPLTAVLELLARLVPAATLDCAAGGVRMRGWAATRLENLGGARVWGPLETDVYLAPHPSQRLRDARAALAELRPILARAESLETLALKARAHRGGYAAALEAGIDEIMSWRTDPRVRVLLQESLGVSFLPRLWRIGIEPSAGAARWRPLLLATHELMGQADALSAEVAAEEAA